MYSNLYNNFNYTTDLAYVISSFIREYDISKANINILFYYGVINQKQYEYYFNLEKKRREVEIGMLQKDKDIAMKLKEGFKEFRRRFFEDNNIQDNEIISIKNDAIYVLNKIPHITRFDNVEFRVKGLYTSFYKIGNLEFYYNLDKVHQTEILDIKGINKSKILLHENHFLEFLKVCFCSAETENIKDTLDIVTTFYNQFINLELDKEYYREFNSYSMYRYKQIFKFHNPIRADFIEEKHLKHLDLCTNMNIIRELYKIYSNIYFSQRR